MGSAQSFPYEVRGIKTHRGHEGETLRQGSLYHEGKKIGFISEGDWGGPAVLDVLPEYKAGIQAFIKAHPPVPISSGTSETLSYCEDLFIDDALNTSAFRKKIEADKRRGRVCFVLPNDEAYSYRSFDAKGQNSKSFVVAHIKSKYPTATIL